MKAKNGVSDGQEQEYTLELFKSPMAVYCSQSYFMQLKDKLCGFMDEGPTSGTHMTVKSLLEILQANLDCLKGCGLELSDVIASEDDLATFKSDLISSI